MVDNIPSSISVIRRMLRRCLNYSLRNIRFNSKLTNASLGSSNLTDIIDTNIKDINVLSPYRDEAGNLTQGDNSKEARLSFKTLQGQSYRDQLDLNPDVSKACLLYTSRCV